ncbi:DUF6714 family protein [Chitinimonas sp. JJ19]|uniref:DUF6714 family protein n=1 Tax=Chitinimonas sp. JJ19 TaxID=3109352 RepID=UPI0030015C8E
MKKIEVLLVREFSAASLVPKERLLADAACKLDECIQVKSIFGGKKWQDISVGDLDYTEGVVLRLSDEAFSYYIAAYLHRFITRYDEADVMLDCIMSMLTPPLSHGEPRPAWVASRLSYWSDAKCGLIAQVLKYLSDEHDCYASKQALAAFWAALLPAP